MANELDGRRIAFMVANEGIEQVELTEPWQAVKTAGGTPELLAPDPGPAQAFNHLDKADTFPVDLENQQDIDDVAAFLRVVNAAENIRRVRKRAQFVKNVRSSGNTAILAAAIADTQDAINDLEQRGLNAAAVNELKDVKTTLETAKANPDSNRAAFMDHALTFLGLARGELITFNPNNQF